MHPRICAVVAVAAVLGSLLAIAAPRATAAHLAEIAGSDVFDLLAEVGC